MEHSISPQTMALTVLSLFFWYVSSLTPNFTKLAFNTLLRDIT